ncbi:MAG TPA: hypothetical protein VH601_16880 [Bryobacteraceae bacterium]|jgi:hypothetical protein
MSILMPLSLVSAIVLMVLLPKRSKAFALALAGVLLMVSALPDQSDTGVFSDVSLANAAGEVH